VDLDYLARLYAVEGTEVISTGTTTYTRYFEEEQEVFPCRCGETHRGDYAFYDSGHHECFHDGVLWWLDEAIKHVMCSLCGNTWVIE